MSKQNNKETMLIKLSASSVKTYDQCPKKYFFNYIEKAPKKHWDHFDLGNACHYALEHFHDVYRKSDDKTKISLEKLMGESFAKSREKFPELNGSLLSEAKEMLSNYLKYVKSNGMPNVIGVESSFNFNIDNDVLIRGFVDRLDLMDNGIYHIVDYKTTKNEKYLEEFQLLVYGLWLLDKYPEIKEFRGSYVLLRHKSKMKSYDFTKEDVEKTKKDLINYASKIRDEDTWSPVPHILCNWCDFKDICPAQKAW